MAKNKIKELRERYEYVCNEYVELFCQKQDMSFEHWVGNEVGGILVCSDFFFSFSDIVLDINTKQKKGEIIKWYDDNMENPKYNINYYSYTKGLRISELKKQKK